MVAALGARRNASLEAVGVVPGFFPVEHCTYQRVADGVLVDQEQHPRADHADSEELDRAWPRPTAHPDL